jgi:hypothetical protein
MSLNFGSSTLRVETLELRDVPAAGSWMVEPFTKGIGTSQLPTNWVQWSDGPGGAVYSVDQAGQGLGGQGRLIADAGSATAGRAWMNTVYSADVEASASIFVNSLAQSQLIVRGRNLNTATPSYYGASAVRGGAVELVKVVNGVTTSLGKVTPMEWVGNTWLTVKLRADGDNIKAFVFRGDTNQYLSSTGVWTRQPTAAVEKVDWSNRLAGFIGFARPKGIEAEVPLDSLKIGPADDSATAPLREERFNTGAAEKLPSGWSSWQADGNAAFSTLSDETLEISGNTNSASRLWMTQPVPTDVQVSTSVYVDSLVPAGIYARGSWLNSNKANFYEVTIKRGMEVELTKSVNGVRTSFGKLNTAGWQSGLWVQMSLIVKGDQLRVQVYRADAGQYLSADGTWSLKPVYAMTRTDKSITSGGLAGLSRGVGAADELVYDNFIVNSAPVSLTTPSIIPTEADKPTTVTAPSVPVNPPLPPKPVPPVPPVPATPTTPPAPPVPLPPSPPVPPLPPTNAALPPVPRNFSHIRIAKLAYSGTELTDYEQSLIKNGVDLIIPNLNLVDDISAVNSKTPQFIYTNVSNVYLGLLTDWLTYADKNKLDRESLFYHVNKATPFSGMSASAVAVNHFWAAYRGNDTKGYTYYTQQVRRGTTPVRLGEAGESFVLGYTEKFRELNFDFQTGAAAGWNGVLEYATAVDAKGNPTAWKTMQVISDTTNGYRTDGRLTFDPPKDWVTSSVAGTDKLYFIRVRTTTGTAAQAPMTLKITGRDYTGHNGDKGTIPAFDSSADLNRDGYLNDAEYARRRTGFDARFTYESRLTFPYYGPYRFATNLSSPNLTSWTIDYHRRFLAENPKIQGFFVDNSIAVLDVDYAGLNETVGSYAELYGNILGTLNRSIGSKWLITNTAGGGKRIEQQVKNGLSYLEEFALRPMTANQIQVDDLLAMLRRRRELSGGRGYEILDSYAGTKFDAADPRVMTSTLAMYYLVADPDRSFLMINGGSEPSSAWSRHWTDAIRFNVGRPTGEATVFAKGADPGNTSLPYQVYSRTYQNALVLYKPLSYKQGVTGTTADNTRTTHALNGWYRMVNNDGSLGARVNSITLRGGEGVTLARA